MNIEKERELFLYEIDGHGYVFENTRWLGNCFEDNFLNMAWELWLASANREGYKFVSVSFLKDINSVAVDEFHKWKIKEEQMPAICEYMQDLSFYIGVEK